MAVYTASAKYFNQSTRKHRLVGYSYSFRNGAKDTDTGEDTWIAQHVIFHVPSLGYVSLVLFTNEF